MTERLGIVIGSDDDHWALVRTNRKDACSGCDDHGGACEACPAASGKIESRVINPVGARTGDTVRIVLNSRHLFTGAALFYLFPIAVILIGVGVGAWGAAALGISATAGAVLGCLAGGGVGFGVVVAVGRSGFATRRLTPVIKAVVRRGAAGDANPCPHCRN